MAATCKVCNDPLVLVLSDGDDEDEAGASSSARQEVPDDLALSCGCHFHWQCLLDLAPQLSLSLACPSCAAPLPSNPPGPSVTNPYLRAPPAAVVLATYTNEGGVQDALDILPALTEEAYLASHPAARPARALHTMCAEGDVGGIVDLLRAVAEDGEDEDGAGEGAGMGPAQLLRYQDPLGGMRSGLHLAVDKGHEDVVILLLWLASSVSTEAFPAEALQSAQAMGLERSEGGDGEDIRSLRDEEGRTAEDIARGMGCFWESMVAAGSLRP